MSQRRLYLLHPAEPPFDQWVREVRSLLQSEDSWQDWSLISKAYDSRHSFTVNEVLGWVNSVRGPVVLLERVQRAPYSELRERLSSIPVLLKSVCDSTDIYAAAIEARTLFEKGEPLLPKKLIVAVLIVRKLIDGNYWTGKEKGYLWASDLPNGRGIPEDLADAVHEVANDLLNKDILVKKTSCGHKKYALNPDRKGEIHKIAQDCTFEDQSLFKNLTKSKSQVSARYLDLQDGKDYRERRGTEGDNTASDP